MPLIRVLVANVILLATLTITHITIFVKKTAPRTAVRMVQIVISIMPRIQFVRKAFVEQQPANQNIMYIAMSVKQTVRRTVANIAMRAQMDRYVLLEIVFFRV